jgi:hypothetical protein
MICSWACRPSSSANTLAHAFSTPTKVTQGWIDGTLPSPWRIEEKTEMRNFKFTS